MAESLGEQTTRLVRETAQEAAQEAVTSASRGDVIREPDGTPNVLATRLRERMRADNDYLVLQDYFDGAQAAQLVCAKRGHDPRASRCMRCGAAVSGEEARARRRA